LDTIEHYWRKAAAGVTRVFRQQTGAEPRLETLERELLALTREHHVLVAQLEKSRTEFEQRDSGALRKLDALEQAHRQSETARVADARRLAELEQLLVGIEAGYQVAHDRVKAMDASLTETSKRLEARANQIKFLQDSAGEQLHALKTMLAEASSRLETSDNELRKVQDSAQEQIAALEGTLAGASNRFESTDSEIRQLREDVAERARQLATVLDSVTTRLEAKDNRVEALEKQIETGHKLQQTGIQDMQEQLDRQGHHLDRVMVMAVVALVLVAATGAMLLLR